MKKADLTVGDRVWVYLPASGGRGYAEILDLNAVPPAYHGKSRTIRVRFEHESFQHYAEGVRYVAPAAIIRKADPEESGASAEHVVADVIRPVFHVRPGTAVLAIIEGDSFVSQVPVSIELLDTEPAMLQYALQELVRGRLEAKTHD